MGDHLDPSTLPLQTLDDRWPIAAADSLSHTVGDHVHDSWNKVEDFDALKAVDLENDDDVDVVNSTENFPFLIVKKVTSISNLYIQKMLFLQLIYQSGSPYRKSFQYFQTHC